MSSSRISTLLSVPCPQWVISDTHFGHEHILNYCPWRTTWAHTLEEHDHHLISAWQHCVKAEEWVLHLGDFALGDKNRFHQLRSQLPGRIILVRGNHDRSPAFMREAGFDIVASGVRIESDNKLWIARHNPSSFSTHEASLATRLFHGHCHGNPIATDLHLAIRAKATDCSLDALKSVSPISWAMLVSNSTPSSGIQS